MFSDQFYPTPESLILKMIEPIKDELRKPGITILEPSAGKGNILDYLAMPSGKYIELYGKSIGKYHFPSQGIARDAKVYAIEKEPELSMILSGKGYRVIDTDFLEYAGSYHFDFILMNPPFRTGAAHLRKAWEVLSAGKIVCILNAETIRNPHTEDRQFIARLAREFGSVEYVTAAFAEAERRTMVDVAIVRLEKRAEENPFDFFSTLGRSADIDIPEDFMTNEIARQDVVGNLVLSYERARDFFLQWLKVEREMKALASMFTRTIYDGNRRGESIWEVIGKAENPKAAYHLFMDHIKSGAWEALFSKGDFEKYLTSRVREKFAQFRGQQGAMEFNKRNIADLLGMLMLNQDQLLQDCVLNVFDEMTKYDESNKVHVEGWKTNDAYRVNRKVILPYFISFMWNGWRDESYKYNLIEDIDKAMCFVTGERIEDILTVKDAVKCRFLDLNGYAIREYETDRKAMQEFYLSKQPDDLGSAYKCFSTFFELRFFKKGTLHLIFRDPKVWEQFNITVAKARGWLPDETTAAKHTNGSKVKTKTGVVNF